MVRGKEEGRIAVLGLSHLALIKENFADLW